MTAPDVRDERPVYGITAQDPPPKLPPADRDALKAYADLARWLYPGPVGEWIARDLVSIAEFGYRFANPSLLARLLAELDVERERRVERVGEAARAAFRGARPESERREASGGGTMPAAAQTSASGELSSTTGHAECHCGAFGSDGRQSPHIGSTTSSANGRAFTYPHTLTTASICTKDGAQ